MFWRNIYTPSRIDTLLENEYVTLQELLDEDDVVQECKSSNKKLIDFLAKPEILEVLLKMVLDEPSGDVDDKMRFKNSNTACELISSDVNQITDILVTADALVSSLFSFLERPEPLNPLQASFFSKIMGLLISRKSELMVELVKSRDGFVSNILRHLGTSAIMDLILRLITCIDIVECRLNCINWLSEQKLPQHLISLIASSETPERNTNAAQTLCDIIRLGKDTVSNFQDAPCVDALLLEVEKKESISGLLDLMFQGNPTESVIVNGLYVLQALLEPRHVGDLIREQSASSSDIDHLNAEHVNDLFLAMLPCLKNFHNLLTIPPKQHYAPMTTSLGLMSQPLGLTRLQVACLIASLVAAHNSAIDAELVSLGTLGVLLDLFFQYPWNNFLHTQVERCVTTVITSKESVNLLLVQLVKDFNLLGRIVCVFQENDVQKNQVGKLRQGYLGHITRIANLVAGRINLDPDGHLLVTLFEEVPEETRQKWIDFVGGQLTEINHANSIELGGTNSVGGQILSSSEEDDDIGYLNFQLDDNLQKAFTDYQSQQMTNGFVEQFGFSEEEFSEQEDSIGSPFVCKISSIDFELSMIEDNPTAAALFEQACNDRIRQFDNVDSDEESDVKEISSFSHVSDNRNSSTIPAKSKRSVSKIGNYEDQAEELDEMEEESEGSSDSEEDLCSPRLIQQANEGMLMRNGNDMKLTLQPCNDNASYKKHDGKFGHCEDIKSEAVQPSVSTNNSSKVADIVDTSSVNSIQSTEDGNNVRLDVVQVDADNNDSSQGDKQTDGDHKQM